MQVHPSRVQCMDCVRPRLDRNNASDKAITSRVIQTNKEHEFRFGSLPFTESMI